MPANTGGEFTLEAASGMAGLTIAETLGAFAVFGLAKVPKVGDFLGESLTGTTLVRSTTKLLFAALAYQASKTNTFAGVQGQMQGAGLGAAAGVPMDVLDSILTYMDTKQAGSTSRSVARMGKVNKAANRGRRRTKSTQFSTGEEDGRFLQGFG